MCGRIAFRGDAAAVPGPPRPGRTGCERERGEEGISRRGRFRRSRASRRGRKGRPLPAARRRPARPFAALSTGEASARTGRGRRSRAPPPSSGRRTARPRARAAGSSGACGPWPPRRSTRSARGVRGRLRARRAAREERKRAPPPPDIPRSSSVGSPFSERRSRFRSWRPGRESRSRLEGGRLPPSTAPSSLRRRGPHEVSPTRRGARSPRGRAVRRREGRSRPAACLRPPFPPAAALRPRARWSGRGSARPSRARRTPRTAPRPGARRRARVSRARPLAQDREPARPHTSPASRGRLSLRGLPARAAAPVLASRKGRASPDGARRPRAPSGPHGRRPEGVADGKEVPVVLRVEDAVGTDRKRRVRRSEREVQKDPRPHRPVRADRIEEPVLTVGVDHAVSVDGGLVDAPLESVRMIRDARHAAVRLPRAALRVRVAERPRGLRFSSSETMSYRPLSRGQKVGSPQ